MVERRLLFKISVSHGNYLTFVIFAVLCIGNHFLFTRVNVDVKRLNRRRFTTLMHFLSYITQSRIERLKLFRNITILI